jgi:hypothetical protein
MFIFLLAIPEKMVSTAGSLLKVDRGIPYQDIEHFSPT